MAVLREDRIVALAEHSSDVDYSSWLLPAVNEVLRQAGAAMTGVDGYAVAAGPGSFTGVRVGLTTVKAWAEVYGKPVAAVSRLEAIAEQSSPARCVAAFVDAQRGQIFGAVYKDNREEEGLTRIGEEMVIAPASFIEEAVQMARGEEIRWLSPDPGLVTGEVAWKDRGARGERLESISATLAPVIGRIGARRLLAGKAVDALTLDANYVRRSDAEIFWKGSSAAHGR